MEKERVWDPGTVNDLFHHDNLLKSSRGVFLCFCELVTQPTNLHNFQRPKTSKLQTLLSTKKINCWKNFLQNQESDFLFTPRLFLRELIHINFSALCVGKEEKGGELFFHTFSTLSSFLVTFSLCTPVSEKRQNSWKPLCQAPSQNFSPSLQCTYKTLSYIYVCTERQRAIL